MNARRSTRRSIAAALAIAAVGAWAADDAHRVPFAASLDTQELVYPGGDCAPAGTGVTTGQGNASHLGRVTLAASDCFAPGRASFSFDHGRLALTAANGDLLYGRYSGSLLPTSAVSPVFTIKGTFVIDGGTGRFAGATGDGVLSGSIDVQTGTGHYDATGAIAY